MMIASVLSSDAAKVAFEYLRNTDANMAFNSHAFTVDNEVISVRGFIGVRSKESAAIEGGFCWGAGDTLSSVVFSAQVLRSRTEFTAIEMPKDWSMTDAEKHTMRLIHSVSPKLYQRMLVRTGEKKAKTGGCYTGPRLEAWKRESKLPANKFGAATNLFTPTFVELAPFLNVTYK